MPIKCKSGKKPRFKNRKIKGGRQRLTFCGSKVKEVKTFKKGKKPITKKINKK